MVNRETLEADPTSVTTLIRWWVSRSQLRFHRVLSRGSLRDFVQDVWLRLLRTFPPGKSFHWKLSSIVCAACEWELKRYRNRNLQLAHDISQNCVSVDEDHQIGFDDVEDLDEVTALRLNIAHTLSELTTREIMVLRARFGLFGDDELTLEQVSAPLKVTRERIRQIERRAIEKLRDPRLSENLLPFWK